MEEIFTNNEATASGSVTDSPKFSHTHFDEDFYTVEIDIPRLSENADRIIVMFSEKLYEPCKLNEGKNILVKGQFRSYNNYSGVGNKLVLVLFAKEMTEITEPSEIESPNRIHITGYLCKEPVYRTTPFGREITDLLVAVNRLYGKSDYIPCIAWGRNAKYSAKLSVGDKIEIFGRMQSREYQKKLEDGDTVTKTAYEVSINRVNKSE